VRKVLEVMFAICPLGTLTRFGREFGFGSNGAYVLDCFLEIAHL